LKKSFNDWLDKPVQKITREMVIKRYSSLTGTGTTTANVAARVLRLTLNHAKNIHAVEEIATDILKEKQAWHKNKRRQRILKMNDIQPWHEAVDVLNNENAKVYLLMLLYMGFRANEALGLKWADVNLIKKTITARNTKNRTDHTLPVPKPLMPYIKGLKKLTGSSKWVFAGDDPSKHMTIPKKQIAKVVKMTDIEFSSHDLRRSFAGYAEAVGVPFGTIKRLLNHAIPDSEVTLGYLITEDETLAANMNKIGAFIHAKATQKGNVIQLQAKQ
jgi:integrase